jgi:hypothetical protein
MNALERWSLHLAALLTAGTGLVYGWLRYFGQRAGEFGPEAHPNQALCQHLHVLSAPMLLLALGMVLKGHVEPLFRGGRMKRIGTGALLLGGLAPMIFGGYAIQVAVDPGWRKLWAWIHGTSSLLFLGTYLLHLGLALAPTPAAEAEPDSG